MAQLEVGNERVEHSLLCDYLFSVMRIARTTLAGLLALLWVPLSSHCPLGSVPGLEFFRCEAQAYPSSSDEDHSCDTSCCSVGFARYQAAGHQEIIPACIAAVVLSDGALDFARSLTNEVSLGVLTAAPPHLLNTWQFSFRAALPVRAPSLTS